MQRRFKISVDGHEYDVAVTEVIEGPGNLYPDRGTMDTARAAAGETARPAAAANAAQGVLRQTAPKPAAGPDDVVSPIAGVVVSIDIALGATVEASTRVATLEAMKTKTFVNAGRNGTIGNIAVAAGDSVEPGQTLLTIA